MTGEIMSGICKICGEKKNLERFNTYFPGIKCECHSPYHFIIQECCKECRNKLEKPLTTKIRLKTDKSRCVGKVYEVDVELLEALSNQFLDRLKESENKAEQNL